MTINWKRGFFRLWVVGAAVWAIVSAFLLWRHTSEFIAANERICDLIDRTSPNFETCMRGLKGPQAGVSWYTDTFHENWPIILAGVAVMPLLFGIAVALWKICAWIFHGFIKRPG